MPSFLSIAAKPIVKKKETKTIEEVKQKEKIKGVYYIKNIPENKYYIGSSSNVDTRLKTHKQHLLKGCHNCRVLQKDFDRLGEENFEFKLIETVKDDLELTAYEKYWIYKHDAIVKYKGYNEMFPTLNHKLFKKIYNLKEKKQCT